MSNITTEIGDGDVIRIWGVAGHTYEGGFTIGVPNVTVRQWDGSPARPLITNTTGTASAFTITANNVTLQGLNISGTNYSEQGSGVSVKGAYNKYLTGFNVNDCIFTGNNVTSWSSCGTIYLIYVNDCRITDTTFENNTARRFGGGAYFLRSNNATLKNVVFKKNSAGYKGGGAYFYLSDNATLTNISFENNMGSESAGGVYFDKSCQATLTNASFNHNTANWGAGAYFWESANANLTDTSFVNNTAAQSGGGVYFFNSANSTLTDTSFDKNKANYDGGGLVFACSDGVVLTGTTFKDNTAYNGGYSYYGKGGGAYFSGSSNSILTDTSFENNTASANGGGFYFGSSENVTLTDMTFKNNKASANGGGFYAGSFNNATLTDMTFKNNTASESGGGLYFVSSDNATLTNISFENNSAKLGGGSYFGGYYYWYDKTLHYIRTTILTDMTFKNNSALESGGGVYFCWSENASLTNTTFENNTAELGGGLYFKSSNETVIKNCFLNNERNLYAELSSAKSLNETALTPGANIAGGLYLGGNVWLRDPVQCISGIGPDADLDGICDQPLTIKSFNGTGTCIGDFGTDAFPLTYGNLTPTLPLDDENETCGNLTPTLPVDDEDVPVQQQQSSSGRRKLLEGTHASFQVRNSAIYEVEVTVGETIPYVFFTVDKKSLPSGMVPPADAVAVYEYDEITHPQVSNNAFERVVLNFSVPKSWLEEHGFAPGDVVLYRYYDGSWQALDTEVLEEDENHVRFSAKAPGLSLFAIGARASAPEPESRAVSELPEPASTPVEPENAQEKSPLWYGEVLLAIGAAYVSKKRRL